MQTHFNKKDYPRDYLERTLIASKGLVERAKKVIDKVCTFKTLMPEFFIMPDINKDLFLLQNYIPTAQLPKLTASHHRVYVSRMGSGENLSPTIFSAYYKYIIMISEYLIRYDYCSGLVIILDCSNVNIINLMTKLNPMEFRQFVILMKEGYGMRVKEIHVITPSKMVDTLLIMLKQVFSEKLGGRIHTHKNKDTIYTFVPKHMLPADYGGEEKSLRDLHGDWLNEVSTEEFVNYFNEMAKANTNESYRQTAEFNEEYISMPGSFRTLTVD